MAAKKKNKNTDHLPSHLSTRFSSSEATDFQVCAENASHQDLFDIESLSDCTRVSILDGSVVLNVRPAKSAKEKKLFGTRALVEIVEADGSMVQLSSTSGLKWENDDGEEDS